MLILIHIHTMSIYLNIVHICSCLYVSYRRYLGLPTPEDNLAGYQRSDVTAKVRNSDPLVRGDTWTFFRRESCRTRSTWWCTGRPTTTCTTSSPWCSPGRWRRLTFSSGNRPMMEIEATLTSFRQLSYPDEAHGLVGLRPHFYHALTDFLLNDCFGRNEVAFINQILKNMLQLCVDKYSSIVKFPTSCHQANNAFFVEGGDWLVVILSAQANGRLRVREWDPSRRRRLSENSTYPITFTPSEQSFERVLLEGLRMYLLDLKHWHCITHWSSEEDENNLGEVFWH